MTRLRWIVVGLFALCHLAIPAIFIELYPFSAAPILTKTVSTITVFDIFDAANKIKVGTDQGYCVRIVVGKSFECHWTTTLAKGQISVDGPFLDAGDSVLSVTGGTGDYAQARGEMRLHARDAKGSAFDFVYVLK